jgi:hypothetical protein
MGAVLHAQGDSGFMLVRDGEVVFKAPVLQHFFDCPLQFGACPDYSESTDTAEDAAVFELAVQPGDVLLAGSDGLWDNCYDSELLQLLPDRPEAVDQVCFLLEFWVIRQRCLIALFGWPQIHLHFDAGPLHGLLCCLVEYLE